MKRGYVSTGEIYTGFRSLIGPMVRWMESTCCSLAVRLHIQHTPLWVEGQILCFIVVLESCEKLE